MKSVTNKFAFWKLTLNASMNTEDAYTASAYIEDTLPPEGTAPDHYQFLNLGEFSTEDEAIKKAYDFAVSWIDVNKMQMRKGRLESELEGAEARIVIEGRTLSDAQAAAVRVALDALRERYQNGEPGYDSSATMVHATHAAEVLDLMNVRMRLF